MMDARKLRGRAIAKTQGQQIVQKGKVWVVPSQSGQGKYTVLPDEDTPFCSCPDHQEAGHVCKHIWSVRYRATMTVEELNADGTTTVTTVQVQAERKTYQQPSWPKYNAAQCNERGHFHDMLATLCDRLPETPRKPGRGRKPVSYRNGLFAAILKVYSEKSARRFNGELEEAHQRGFIDCVPHFTSVLSILDKPEITPLLNGMIEATALPLLAVETDFAVDSTGFGTTKYASWYDKKYNQMKEEQVWVKAHFCTGVRTNVVTNVCIKDQNAADAPRFAPLVARTAELGFKIGEVSGDKAYASHWNFEAVEAVGGQFFPMFKENATGGIGGAFEKAFHYFSLNKEEYLAHYHKRSNVESTVSMVKRKFGDAVKAKNDTAQKNEVYAKFVCHNLAVLIQEMYVMGIDPTFGKRRVEPQPVALKIFGSA